MPSARPASAAAVPAAAVSEIDVLYDYPDEYN